MSVNNKTIAEEVKDFKFNDDNIIKVKEIIAKYPEGRQASAVLPLLDLAQRQAGGWLPRAALDCIATTLNMPFIKVYEVASFYTMFNLQPVGKYLLQVCGTTPCYLRGAGEIMKECEMHLGIKNGETTCDKLFTLKEVECLGACVNAPIVQMNDDYYEDLDASSVIAIIENLKASKEVTRGSQKGRQCSAPEGSVDSQKKVK